MIGGIIMGDLIPLERLLIKMIHRDAKKEDRELYRVTAAFQDPDPPSPEKRELMEEGFVEI